jgi:hypothetical protein
MAGVSLLWAYFALCAGLFLAAGGFGAAVV